MGLLHFRTEELVDRQTYERMGDAALDLFTPTALAALEDLRAFFNEFRPTSIMVNNWPFGGTLQWRGYRTREKAAQLGSPNSQHAAGNAFDCNVSGYTAEQARRKILTRQDHPLLRKITRLEADVRWLHFDCKPLAANQRRIYVFRA